MKSCSKFKFFLLYLLVPLHQSSEHYGPSRNIDDPSFNKIRKSTAVNYTTSFECSLNSTTWCLSWYLQEYDWISNEHVFTSPVLCLNETFVNQTSEAVFKDGDGQQFRSYDPLFFIFHNCSSNGKIKWFQKHDEAVPHGQLGMQHIDRKMDFGDLLDAGSRAPSWRYALDGVTGDTTNLYFWLRDGYLDEIINIKPNVRFEKTILDSTYNASDMNARMINPKNKATWGDAEAMLKWLYERAFAY